MAFDRGMTRFRFVGHAKLSDGISTERFKLVVSGRNQGFITNGHLEALAVWVIKIRQAAFK